MMNRKRKYRYLILAFLALDLMLMGWLGYRILDRKIPDQILVDHENSREVASLLKRPFVSFDDAIAVSGKDSYTLHCRVLGVIPFKDVKVKHTTAKEVYVSGAAVGIYMQTKGVLIIDTGEILSESGETEEPARDIVKPGDYIVAFNQNRIQCKQDLLEDLADLDGESVTLKVRRGKETIPLSLTPVKDEEGKYKLEIWVRDDTQGIGTMTYVKPDGAFGALGHGIHDTDTNTLMEIKDGRVYETSIRNIQKGAGGEPGGIEGIIVYNRYNVLGTIDKNTDCGIFGTLERTDNLFRNTEPVGIMATDEIKKGDAVIRCCVEGKVKEYKIRITKTDKHTKEENKGLEIKVTDPGLLEITGGIIQGMSGAPILQNGKIAGAVTHVFVNDPAMGYGIFIENMLKHVE